MAQNGKFINPVPALKKGEPAPPIEGKMKAEFANENGTLFPNQFVNVRMLTQTLTDATLVPTPAIQRGAPGTFVYVVKGDNTVTVAPVKLGPQQGETTVVTSAGRSVPA